MASAAKTLGFDGREIPIHEGDTIGSALYRAGVDTVSRSFKYHRRRGFLCMSGDCPNCLVQVDGETGVRCCTRAAVDGMKVEPQNVMGSVEHDRAGDQRHEARAQVPAGRLLLQDADQAALALAARRADDPQGRRPRAASTPATRPRHLERVYRHPDVVVLGAGPAGLAAALGAAEAGASVIIADEAEPGGRLGAGATRDARARAAAAGRGARAHRAAARPPRVRPLRGPRGAADRARTCS